MGGSHYRVEAEEMKRTAEKKKTKGRRKNGGYDGERRRVRESLSGGGETISTFYFFQKLIEIEIIYRSTCSEAGLIRSIRGNDREMSSGSLSSRDRGEAAS